MSALVRLREAAGLTVEQLAAKAGATPARVSAWERGAEVPTTREVGLLALALGVAPAAVQDALARREKAGGEVF
jgi:transcriptional regulator with XRE-family HTH domain